MIPRMPHVPGMVNALRKLELVGAWALQVVWCCLAWLARVRGNKGLGFHAVRRVLRCRSPPMLQGQLVVWEHGMAHGISRKDTIGSISRAREKSRARERGTRRSRSICVFACNGNILVMARGSRGFCREVLLGVARRRILSIVPAWLWYPITVDWPYRVAQTGGKGGFSELCCADAYSEHTHVLLMM